MSTIERHEVDTTAIIDTLNQCIEICIDGEKGYAAAASDVHNLQLKSLFYDESKQRGGFAEALQAILRKLGATPTNEGTAKGKLHRGWMSVRGVTERGSDRAIVDEWIRGERAAVRGYGDALERTPLSMLPADIRGVLQVQYTEIREALGVALRQRELAS